MVACPLCDKLVQESNINEHIDSGCESFVLEEGDSGQSTARASQGAGGGTFNGFFSKATAASTAPSSSPHKTEGGVRNVQRTGERASQPALSTPSRPPPTPAPVSAVAPASSAISQKRKPETWQDETPLASKKPRVSALEKAAPLAERMRPKTLDEVYGQSLVGPNGVLRGLVEAGRVPSMILWGGPGTGKTTIARLVAKTADKRFVEINSTSSGVAECKKLFAEARNELTLTGRGTIIFCDEIHRFSKSQQDVFLGPVEAGQVTLIGATTENPSFKVVNALLSRCRTFTLAKLSDADIAAIMDRALTTLFPAESRVSRPGLVDAPMVSYLAAFADGDARTALNLLDLAIDLSSRPEMTADELKSSLTATLVYDRAGDQHYDTISAFHKSVRGSDADATLYYLARMISSGEDALYIARRMVVIASEDVGLASPHMLPLAIAAYTAAEKVGLPEARINLAHVAVALALSPKSTRAYRGLGRAEAACREPGVAGLPVPMHLRNAPTRLLKELGHGAEYKYNPDYIDGRVKQTYLPPTLQGRRFLEDEDFGDKHDSDLDREVSAADSTKRVKHTSGPTVMTGTVRQKKPAPGDEQSATEKDNDDDQSVTTMQSQGSVFEDDFDKPDSSYPVEDNDDSPAVQDLRDDNSDS